jgi:hypothetical protein
MQITNQLILGVQIMSQNHIVKATNAIAECIANILASGGTDDQKSLELAASFAQMQDYLTKNIGGGSGDSAGVTDHHVSQLADLVVESTAGRISREQALAHLLHTNRGAALLHRTRKDNSMPDSIEKIIADHGGIVAVAKNITLTQDPCGINEHEFTQLVTEYAKTQHPNLTEAQAFEKVFAANDETGRTLRQAYALTKALPPRMDFEPIVVSGATAFQDTLADRSEAYDQLVEMARKMRARVGGAMSEAQAFERTLADPTNRALAERALSRPLPPAGGYPFPRQSSPGRQ